MYQTIIIEKRKKPYVFTSDLKSEAEDYANHMFDKFTEAKFKPQMHTTRDALGNIYIRVRANN